MINLDKLRADVAAIGQAPVIAVPRASILAMADELETLRMQRANAFRAIGAAATAQVCATLERRT